MMDTEMVPEMSLIFNQLTRLIAREDFINVRRRKSFSSYKSRMAWNVRGQLIFGKGCA
jgi:hypothetical protein